MADSSKYSRSKQYLAISLLGLVMLPLPAMAYLDPTTGSMIISAIVGLFASLVLAVKTYWYRLKGFFTRKPDESPADEDTR